jgi:hypothetical protein
MATEFDWLYEGEGSADTSVDTGNEAVAQSDAPDVSDPAERRKQLEAMKDLGGTWAKLATEALASMDDRDKAASRAELVEQADELTVEGLSLLMAEFESVRLDPEVDPAEASQLSARVEAVKDALRAQVEADRVRDDARFLSALEASYRDPQLGWADETIAEKMANHKEELAEAQAFRAESDAIEESALWQLYQQQVRQQVREAQAIASLQEDRINRKREDGSYGPTAYDAELLAAGQKAEDDFIDSLVGA